ncbi:MAG: hypothetical protein IJL40_01535 [Oscillospiraceae bacterium]|nr:hypothetical protein [Oscillospiraceae bacterium]
MKAKKLLVLLLGLALVFAFAACGPTDEEAAEEAPAEETAEEAAEEPAAEDAASETEEAAEVELPEINVPGQAIEFASPFTFKVNGTEVTSDQLKDLQIYKVKLENFLLDKDGNPATNKDTGEPLVVSYTGYKVVDILEAIGVEGSSVYAAASDGYESDVYDLSANPDYLILAVEKDKEQAPDGTLFFAPCFEQTTGRYVHSVVELIVE